MKRILRKLIELTEPSAIASPDVRKRTPLLAAFAHDQDDLCEALISTGTQALFEVAGEDGNTIVHKVCLKNKRVLLASLLAQEASPIAPNERGSTPLHLACEAHGKNDISRVLIERICNLPKPLEHLVRADSEGNTPLHIACKGKNYETVAELIKRIVTLSDGDVKYLSLKNTAGSTPMHVALVQKDENCAKELLGNEAALAARTSNQETCLHLAIRHCPNFAPLLIDRGIRAREEHEDRIAEYEEALERRNAYRRGRKHRRMDTEDAPGRE